MINVGFLIGVVIITICEIYTVSKYYSKKVNLKKLSFYIFFLLIVALSMFNYTYANGFIKIIFSTLILGFLNYFIFKEKILITIICTLFLYFLLTVSDIIDAFILIFVF